MSISGDVERLRVFCEGPFEGFCTPVEFAEIYGIDESTVRQAIRSGRLVVGQDCFKFGKQWVLSKYAFPKFKRGCGFGKISELKVEYKKAIRDRSE